MKNFLKNRDWTLAALFLTAFAFRLFLMLQARSAVGFDEAHYLRLAGSFLAQGLPGILHPYWPPLFSACIALVHLIVGNLEIAARLLNIFLGSLAALVIYHLARQLFGRKKSLLAAALFAFYPPIAFSHTNVMAETVYTFLGLSGIFAGLKSLTQGSIKWAITAGLCWSGCYLVRPEGIGFLLVYIGFSSIWFLIEFFKKRDFRKIILIFCAAFSFSLLAGPYLYYLRQATGKWVLSTKGEVNQQLEAAVIFEESQTVKDPFYHLTKDNQHLPYDMAYHFGNLRQLTASQEGQKRIVGISLKNYIVKYSRNFYKLIRYAIPQTVTALFLILGALGFFMRSYKIKEWPFILYFGANILFFWFVLIPLFHVNNRYLMPLFPLVFIWAAPGLVALTDWLKSSLQQSNLPDRFNRIKKRIPIILTLFFLSLGYLPEMGKIASISKDSSDMWADPVELKEAGLWLKGQTDSPPTLMSLNKAVDFYAGQYDMKLGASFSYDPIDRNVAYALHRQVDYLVMSERYLSWFPNLSPLFELEEPHPQLQRVYDKTNAAGPRTVVYRLLPDDREGE